MLFSPGPKHREGSGNDKPSSNNNLPVTTEDSPSTDDLPPTDDHPSTDEAPPTYTPCADLSLAAPPKTHVHD
jgi:hypothetical protein